jgi:hypothetical protein
LIAVNLSDFPSGCGERRVGLLKVDDEDFIKNVGLDFKR